MYFKHSVVRDYCWLVIFFIILTAISCSCDNHSLNQDNNELIIKERLSHQSKSLDMEVLSTSLLDDQKTIQVIFTKLNSSKKTDLRAFKLQVTFRELGGTGSIITYLDETGKTKKITTTFPESLSEFVSYKELVSDKNSVRVPFTLLPTSAVTAMEITFKLLGKEDEVLKEYTVNWQKKPLGSVQLKFTKFMYDSISSTLNYAIQNTGTIEAKEVQLYYENISQDLTEKTVSLNNYESSVIDLTDILPGASMSDKVLTIDFKTANKATFRFKLLYKDKSKLVEGSMREEEFHYKTPQINLIPLTSTKLIGTDKIFKYRIIKAVSSGNIDLDKLKLKITDNLGTDARLFHQKINKRSFFSVDKEITNVYTNEIRSFKVKPGLDLKASYTCQLNYADKDIGEPITFTWEIDSKTAQERLLKAIESKSSSKNTGDENRIMALLQVPGIDFNIRNRYGQTPLNILMSSLIDSPGELIEAERLEIAEELLKKGAEVDAVSNSGFTPLHLATEVRNVKAVKLLVKYGADVNKINTADFPTEFHKRSYIRFCAPLYLAAGISATDTTEIINLFLHKGADINIIAGPNSDTPLHQAVQAYSPENVKLLLARGARTDIKNKNGETAVDLAKKSSDNRIRSLFGLELLPAGF